MILEEVEEEVHRLVHRVLSEVVENELHAQSVLPSAMEPSSAAAVAELESADSEQEALSMLMQSRLLAPPPRLLIPHGPAYEEDEEEGVFVDEVDRRLQARRDLSTNLSLHVFAFTAAVVAMTTLLTSF